MSIINSILDKANRSLPSNVGTAYNKLTKLGSWVTSGIDAYKDVLRDLDQIKLYLKRWKNLSEDPTVLFYTIDNILRDNIKRPPISNEEYNKLRKLLIKYYGPNSDDLVKKIPTSDPEYSTRVEVLSKLINEQRDPNFRKSIPLDSTELGHSAIDKIKEVKELRSLDSLSKRNKLPEDNPNDSYTRKTPSNREHNEINYNQFNDPFDVLKTVKDTLIINGTSIDYNINPDQLVNTLNDIGYHIGYKHMVGFEMSDNNIWDVQIYPYREDIKVFDRSIRPSIDNRYSLVPDLPRYKLPNLSGEGWHDFSFSSYCPVMSWTLNQGSLDTAEFNLYKGSSISFPIGYKYDFTLSLSILDDVYMSMDKYMRQYVNSIYDVNTGAVAPYWASCFYIPITIFRPGYNVNYMFNLIASPISWNSEFTGNNNSGDERTLNIEFAVIGMEKPNDTKVYSDVFTGLDPESKLGELTWNKITLRP